MTRAAVALDVVAGIGIGPGTEVLLNRTLHVEGVRSRFGDPVWDLSGAIKDRHSARQAVHWGRFPAPFRHACKLYLFALLNLVDDAPRLDSARSLHPHVKTILGELVPLRRFTTWLSDAGVTSFDQVSTEHLDDYLHYVTDATGESAGTKRCALQAIKRLHLYREELPAQCRLPAGPLWGGASARGLAHYESSWGKPNTTPRIHPDVMEPLLSGAIAVTHTIAADLLPAARNLLAMRHLAHQIAPAIRRAPTRTVSVFETTKAQLECMLAALDRNDAALPGIRTGEVTSVDLMGLAVGGWMHHTELKRMKETPVMLAASGLPIDVNLLRINTFSHIGTKPWRDEPVDARELVGLLRHVTVACFLVIAYLSGVRTGEALNLRRGCISRDPTLELTFMSGLQLKADDGRRQRSPATIPWVVTDETAHAVTVLEQITVSDLLFPAFSVCSQQRFLFGATRTRTPGSINTDITRFIDWFNQEVAPVVDHPLIPADPYGSIQVPRLRRTLAWHIVRRPGGTIAGATQYGHLHTQMIHGYAGGADSGFPDDITFERFLHRAETIHDDAQRLEAGEHVSGPAAEEYRARIARARTFAGLTVTTTGQVNAALSNPALQIHHGAVLTCVFRRATAACLPPSDSSDEPSWTRCRLGCINAARTDRDAVNLREHVGALQQDMAAPGLPEPLRQRIQTRLVEHRKALTDHESSRGIAELAPGFGMAEVGPSFPGSVSVISGHDSRYGDRAFIDQIMLGWTGGAGSPQADGWLMMAGIGDAGAIKRDSIEIDEVRFPFRIDRHELVPDTEGAGTHRGAPSAAVEITVVDDPVEFMYMSDGTVNPARGAVGGESGAPAIQQVRRLDGTLETHGSCGRFVVAPGETLITRCCGGGGYGDPKERDPQRVRADVEAGVVTRVRAARVYGVEVGEDNTIDVAATAALRATER